MSNFVLFFRVNISCNNIRTRKWFFAIRYDAILLFLVRRAECFVFRVILNIWPYVIEQLQLSFSEKTTCDHISTISHSLVALQKWWYSLIPESDEKYVDRNVFQSNHCSLWPTSEQCLLGLEASHQYLNRMYIYVHIQVCAIYFIFKRICIYLK